MTFNVVEAVEAEITPDEVTRVAESTGETSSKTRHAMSSGVLAIIGGLIHRTSSRSGAASLLSTLQSPPLRGTSLTSGLLGDKADEVTNSLASSGGVSRGAASTILSSIMPAVARVLGREATSRKLDAGGLSDMLASQKDIIAGRSNREAIGRAEVTRGTSDVSVSGAPPAPAPRVMSPQHAPIPAPPKKSSLWLALGAIALGALLLFLFFGGRRSRTPEVAMPEAPKVDTPLARAPELPRPQTPDLTPQMPAAPPAVPPPEPTPEPTSQTTTTGAEIAGSDAIGEHFTGKGELPDRFALPGVLFAFSTTKMEPGGDDSVERLATMMKEHPSAQLRLEGHTDNAGDTDVNSRLSYERAATVRKLLIDRGVDGKRIEVVGKRDLTPVAPNDTREGRAMNRRIDAVIIAR